MWMNWEWYKIIRERAASGCSLGKKLGWIMTQDSISQLIAQGNMPCDQSEKQSPKNYAALREGYDRTAWFSGTRSSAASRVETEPAPGLQARSDHHRRDMVQTPTITRSPTCWLGEKYGNNCIHNLPSGRGLQQKQILNHQMPWWLYRRLV